jgi:methionyl-tRNA formyltransferase
VIEPSMTAGGLTDVLAALGAELIVEALANVETLAATPQPEGATYASKIDKGEAWIDWRSSSEELERKVRAFDPFPVASTWARETPIKLWRAEIERGAPAAPPGTIVASGAHGVTIACGTGGALRVVELQRPGARRLPAREFLAGFPLQTGDRCGPPPSG